MAKYSQCYKYSYYQHLRIYSFGNFPKYKFCFIFSSFIKNLEDNCTFFCLQSFGLQTVYLGMSIDSKDMNKQRTDTFFHTPYVTKVTCLVFLEMQFCTYFLFSSSFASNTTILLFAFKMLFLRLVNITVNLHFVQ